MKTDEDETFYGHIDQYHAKRRLKILNDHPELRQLFRVDPSFKYVATACTLTQLFIAYQLSESSLGFILFYALAVGTLFDCAIANATHETVHHLAFPNAVTANRVFGCFINLALAMPSFAGYYRTHRNHHAYIGSDLDVKYPSLKQAAKYDQTIWKRIQFVLQHPINGGTWWNENVGEEFGPFVTYNEWLVWSFDLLILLFWGWRSLLYLLVSFWSNDCFFVQGSKNLADHWVANDGQAYTCSNYGWFNYINFNIGYHREHHDLPNIPGRYLAMVPEIAPEHYDDERFIAPSLFTAMIRMLTAPPGEGLRRHANKNPAPFTIRKGRQEQSD